MICRVLQAYGLVVSIQTDAPDLLPLVEPQLPSFPDAPASSAADLEYQVKIRPGGGVAVLRGRRTLANVSDVPAASSHLVMDLQTAIARHAAGYTFVHSGVVAINERALVLPGRSHAGKSTLVAALVRMGAKYGSDEFAVVDSTGLVHPYPRRLALRTETAVSRIAACDLGGEELTEGLHAAAVVFTEYQSGAALSLAPLTAGAVVLRLLQHCLGVRGRPSETMLALRALARSAAGFASLRGDADDTARLLIAMAEQGWRPPA